MSDSTYEVKTRNVFLCSKMKTEPTTTTNLITMVMEKDLNGNEFQVSAWLTESKNGKKYFSCKLQEPYKKETAPNQVPTATASVVEGDPDLPFLIYWHNKFGGN